MNNLEIAGLSQKEIETYKNLLSLKRATVLQLAQIFGEKRTNLYRDLESLIKKKLVSEIYEGKKHYYIAEPPKALMEFVNEGKKKIESIIPDLEDLEKKALERPKIKYYEGKQGVKALYDEILDERQEILAFTWPDKLLDSITFHDYLVKERLKRKIPARAIYPDIRAAHKRDTGMKESRYVKKLNSFDSTFLISGNKVVTFSLKRWVTGVVIENKEIADGLRAFFDALWLELGKKKRK